MHPRTNTADLNCLVCIKTPTGVQGRIGSFKLAKNTDDSLQELDFSLNFARDFCCEKIQEKTYADVRNCPPLYVSCTLFQEHEGSSTEPSSSALHIARFIFAIFR